MARDFGSLLEVRESCFGGRFFVHEMIFASSIRRVGCFCWPARDVSCTVALKHQPIIYHETKHLPLQFVHALPPRGLRLFAAPAAHGKTRRNSEARGDGKTRGNGETSRDGETRRYSGANASCGIHVQRQTEIGHLRG